jgi:hypothetical protein
MEAGWHAPGRDVLKRLAKVLGVTPESLEKLL